MKPRAQCVSDQHFIVECLLELGYRAVYTDKVGDIWVVTTPEDPTVRHEFDRYGASLLL